MLSVSEYVQGSWKTESDHEESSVLAIDTKVFCFETKACDLLESMIFIDSKNLLKCFQVLLVQYVTLFIVRAT